MAAGDATPFPRKNTAYRVTFPILDADGDLVTGATGLDSEVSKDAGTFADCTNEATEIATSSGIYYLDLTSTEMNADTVAIIVKTSSSGAKTTTIVMYPVESTDIDVNVTAFGGTAGTFSAGRAEVNTSHWGGTAVASAVVPANTIQISGDSVAADNCESFFDGTGYAGTGNTIPTVTTCTNVTTVNGIAAGAITASAIAADAIGASELAADAVAEIADAVWDEVLSGHLTAGSTGAGLNAAGSAGDPWSTALPGAYGAGSAGYILGTNLDAAITSRLATAGYAAPLDAAGTRSAVGLASANLDTQLTAIDDYLDTEVAAIKAKTDQMVFSTANRLDVQVYGMEAGVVTAAAVATGAIDADALATDAVTELVTGVLTTQMTESYRATNAAPTLAQAAFEMIAHMGEKAIVGTTLTLKKLDGSTTAKTYTLDSGTAATSITETT